MHTSVPVWAEWKPNFSKQTGGLFTHQLFPNSLQKFTNSSQSLKTFLLRPLPGTVQWVKQLPASGIPTAPFLTGFLQTHTGNQRRCQVLGHQPPMLETQSSNLPASAWTATAVVAFWHVTQQMEDLLSVCLSLSLISLLSSLCNSTFQINK